MEIGIWDLEKGILDLGWGKKVGMRAGKLKDKESQGKGRIKIHENRAYKNSRYEKTYFILVSIFLAAILFYALYIGELLWGIVIDILILRLYFLMKRERRYFRKCDRNEEEAGIPHDPKMKRRIRVVNIILTIFVLALVIKSYFTSQFLLGIIAGLLILLYIHMLLFSGDNI